MAAPMIPARETKQPRKYMAHRQNHYYRDQQEATLQPHGPNPWKVLLVLVASFLCLVLLFFDHVYLIAFDPPVSTTNAHDKRQPSLAVVIDVLSVGSTERWEFVKRQQQTWGSHPSIRFFQGVNEGHHDAYGNATCTDVRSQIEECMERYDKIPADAQGRRYHIAPEIKSLALPRNRPDGWWCAQRRLVIGLYRLFAERYTHLKDYPDWLLIVDDETFYNMTIFQYSLSPLDPNHVHVVVGMETMFHWGHGDYGVALSRAAVQRLYAPLHCRQQEQRSRQIAKSGGLQSYMKSVCRVILQKNLLFESEIFQDGMSVLELMLAIQLHRRPFCWQSDWYLGWFLSHHVLLGERSPVLFPLCPPYECHPQPNEICLNSSLACHAGNVIGYNN